MEIISNYKSNDNYVFFTSLIEKTCGYHAQTMEHLIAMSSSMDPHFYSLAKHSASFQRQQHTPRDVHRLSAIENVWQLWDCIVSAQFPFCPPARSIRSGRAGKTRGSRAVIDMHPEWAPRTTINGAIKDCERHPSKVRQRAGKGQSEVIQRSARWSVLPT